MRLSVLGVPVDDVSLPDLLGSVTSVLRFGGQASYTSVNLANWHLGRRDPRVCAYFASSTFITADGWPIAWAARVLNREKVPRIPALELFEHVMQVAAAEQYGVFVLGSSPSAAELAAERLGRDYGVTVVGYHHGFIDVDHDAIPGPLMDGSAQILLLGMGAPKEQAWVCSNLARTTIRFAIGIGGGVDILAGRVRRAPLWMRQIGMEWAFRLMSEPRRLWWRYPASACSFALAFTVGLVSRRDHLYPFEHAGDVVPPTGTKE
jgi:N-acetylglucosaminyldiphosphoundecaprenol N-acetyl-beta-D-mannosaminyltransferase